MKHTSKQRKSYTALSRKIAVGLASGLLLVGIGQYPSIAFGGSAIVFLKDYEIHVLEHRWKLYCGARSGCYHRGRRRRCCQSE